MHATNDTQEEKPRPGPGSGKPQRQAPPPEQSIVDLLREVVGLTLAGLRTQAPRLTWIRKEDPS
ncbi:hypothetical protein [Streptomyces sp. NPDC002640]